MKRRVQGDLSKNERFWAHSDSIGFQGSEVIFNKSLQQLSGCCAPSDGSNGRHLIFGACGRNNAKNDGDGTEKRAHGGGTRRVVEVCEIAKGAAGGIREVELGSVWFGITRLTHQLSFLLFDIRMCRTHCSFLTLSPHILIALYRSAEDLALGSYHREG